MEDPESHLIAFQEQMIISGGSDAHGHVYRICSAMAQKGSQTAISPLFHSFLECLRNNSQLIKLTPHGCPTLLRQTKGRKASQRFPKSFLHGLGKASDSERGDGGCHFR